MGAVSAQWAATVKTKFHHYHMCGDCGIKMGGKLDEDRAITVIIGICKYCEVPIKQTLIPWVDFNWPKDLKTDRAAKINRD